MRSYTDNESAAITSKARVSEIKITNLLDIVKDNYPEFLSDDIRTHYGIDTEKEKDLRFSTRDSDDNELTDAQAEFFKDSKVRDQDGNLLVMYHGTSKEFTVFRPGTAMGWGTGIYFTDYKPYTDQFGDVKVKAYLNIKNPFDNRTNTKFPIKWLDLYGDLWYTNSRKEVYHSGKIIYIHRRTKGRTDGCQESK